MSVHKEIAFEDAIERAMLDSGWLKGQASNYHRELGLDTAELFAFIGATQVDKWDQLVTFEGGDPDAAQRKFAERVAREIESRGTLDVLRHGVKDRGLLFRLAYFRPAHTLADDALVEYEKNRLTVTRQLHYSVTTPDKSLDLVLFVNGIPVATAELKNPLTRQTVEHAKAQYRQRPRPARAALRPPCPRALRSGPRPRVHHDPAARATRPGSSRSTGQARIDGGAGNPPEKDGYRTSYLWEEVWQPTAWLDISGASCTSRRRHGRQTVHQRAMIFPRFHQWDAVRTLRRHAAEARLGAQLPRPALGRLRQVEHDRLARAPAVQPARRERSQVFDKVIVITDRSVLDRSCRTRSTSSSTTAASSARSVTRTRREVGAGRRGALRGDDQDPHRHAPDLPARAGQGQRAAR